MEKIFFFLMAALSCMPVHSQDTVDSFLRGGYFYNNLPDAEKGYYPSWALYCGEYCGITAKEMYTKTKEPITIYGVAACMVTNLDFFYIPDSPTVDSADWWRQFFEQDGDTSTADLYEYLGVYLRDADSLVPHREVMVHKRYDTPAYYVSYGYAYYNPDFCYPIYEKYFDSSITVLDTFYMGVTGRTVYFWSETENMSFGLMEFNGDGCRGFHEYHVWKFCNADTSFWDWPIRSLTGDEYYMIFPILTPGHDTTGTGGDTTAVTQADMVGRYVAVQPNPTSDEARVLSSFGLERIEAFNTEGRRVADLPASGLEATLDVRRWPAGTYLLRVTTPAGTVTKRLLVR